MTAYPSRNGLALGLRLIVIAPELLCEVLKRGTGASTPTRPAPEDTVVVHAMMVRDCVGVLLGSVHWPLAKAGDDGFVTVNGLPAIKWAPTFHRGAVPHGGKP